MRYAITILLTLMALLIQGCGKDEPPVPVEVKQMTLIYAVNGNNLSSNLYDNERQMLQAMQTVEPGAQMLLVYKSIDPSTAGLFKVVSGKGTLKFEQIKSYSRDVWSTDPGRISEVIADALAVGNAEKNNLFLWGHGMAWSPLSPDLLQSAPQNKAFGGDNNSQEWVEIRELAEAIPDGKFDLIWFDCCYMANIEALYQFRGKTDRIVAYPTEIWEYGLPYNTVLPHIMKDEFDLNSAADALFDYYNRTGSPVTVSVFDMTRIDELAGMCSEIYAAGPERPAENTLLNYSRDRMHDYDYYDFGQFVEETAKANGKEEILTRFRDSLDKFVTYTLASENDFFGKQIDPEKYHGVSTHFYKGVDTAEERYYRTLDWFKDVYE